MEDNIRLGGKQGAEEMIRTVCFEEETKAMDDGIHTLVGTSGVRLSGGQAQRLALARTLYHKRLVLVLDDPFSALDKKTEAQIFANVKELAYIHFNDYNFEEIKTSEHGISPKFHWSTRPGTMFRPHAAVSCYNPNKSGSKFSVKFVFISFAIHCDS